MTEFPVTYIPDFMTKYQSNEMFETLWVGLNWEHREFAPRKEYWTNDFNRSYTYGRGVGIRTYESQESHTDIDWVRTKLMGVVDFWYEGCFLNGYKDERDALGWHSDDDPGIDHSKPIAVVTIGNGREIQFMDKNTREIGKQFLDPGSLLLMHAGMQDTHLHRIPKAGYKAGPRISLTFRSLLPSLP